MASVKSIGIQHGKHKVKRFLYHFTSIDNYEKMLKDKNMKMSKKDRYLDKSGIFMVDLPNYTNRWLNNDTYWSTQNLALTLMSETCHNQDKLVCLRIPTKNLDHSKLKIRSQDKFFNHQKKFLAPVSEHIKVGDEAKNRGLYTQRKECIEHIYQDEIPMDKVELVGIVDIDRDKVCRRYDERGAKQKNIVIDILKRLFKGQPEEKGVNYIV